MLSWDFWLRYGHFQQAQQWQVVRCVGVARRQGLKFWCRYLR